MNEFLYPFLSACVVGMLTGLATGTGANLAKIDNVVSWGALAGLVAALLAFVSFRARTIRAVELSKGLDLEPPPPATTPKQQVIKIELRQDEGRAVDYAFLNCTQAQLSELAQGLNAGKPLTVGAWTGNGRAFSRAQFEHLRHELITRNLVTWRNPGSPAQGVILTAAGRATMRYLATTPPPKTAK
jgi:hypothetical protein